MSTIIRRMAHEDVKNTIRVGLLGSLPTAGEGSVSSPDMSVKGGCMMTKCRQDGEPEARRCEKRICMKQTQPETDFQFTLLSLLLKAWLVPYTFNRKEGLVVHLLFMVVKNERNFFLTVPWALQGIVGPEGEPVPRFMWGMCFPQIWVQSNFFYTAWRVKAV